MNALPNSLNNYMDDDGRLNGWPSKRTKQTAALEYLATKFEPGRQYTELETNEILKRWHTFGDWAMLRRDMVDAGLLVRDDHGYSYELGPAALVPSTDKPS